MTGFEHYLNTHPEDPCGHGDVDQRMRLVCLECDRKFRSDSMIPSCPKCGGSDVEIAD